MPVDWNKMEPQKYEDMISVLLSRLYPDARRIDGRGGDGGRDVQIVHKQDGSIAHAFELKSFTERMKPSRRSQITHSLKRAALLEPERWTLVVPIDHNPSEEEWFRKLGETFCFPIVWHGKTWLDEKMSAFPDIRRYFLEGAKDEVYDLLRDITQEQARLTDVQDAVGRIRKLIRRLDEIDPHYRYEFATGASAASHRPSDVAFSVSFGDLRVDVYPKYKGASKDRPITIKANIIVSEEIKNSLDYGLGVTIPSHLISDMTVDAPGGLGGSFTGCVIDIIPTDTKLDAPVVIALDVMDGNRVQVSWPIRLTERNEGFKGFVFTGADSTGWLETRLNLNVATGELAAEFKLAPKPVLPSVLLPLWQWLIALQPGRELKIRWPGDLEIRTEMRSSFQLDERLGRVIEAFAYLQAHCGIYWEISPALTLEEAQEIVTIAALMKGESIDFTWEPVNLNLDRWEPTLVEMIDGQPRPCLLEHDAWFELEGQRIPMGRIRTYFESVRIADLSAVRQAAASDSPLHLQLVPGNNNKGQRVLMPEAREGSESDESL